MSGNVNKKSEAVAEIIAIVLSIIEQCFFLNAGNIAFHAYLSHKILKSSIEISLHILWVNYLSVFYFMSLL